MQSEMQYQAPWWLPGGNLQTIWAAVHARRHAEIPPVFCRERWTTPDGDFVDVDHACFAPTLPTACGSLPPGGAACRGSKPASAGLDGTQKGCVSQLGGLQGLRLRPGKASPAAPAGRGCLSPRFPPLSDRLKPVEACLPAASLSLWPGAESRAPASGELAPSLADTQASRPLLVLFHGLEGSSGSHYAQAFADVASRRGWDFAVPHFRGCSGQLNLAPRAYHSGDFAEIDWILRQFAAEHRGPVVAVGVSLGGNALMRWAGEMGQEAGPVVAAVASVCAPLDLAASGHAIGRGFNRQVYTRMFLQSMVPKALEKLDQHPGLFDREALLAARDLYAFDDIFTGPVHGFSGVDDYWKRASAKPHLGQIAVPALVLNALNDPFIPSTSLPKHTDVSPQVTLWQPAHGGHVGFPSSDFPAHVRAMPEAVTGFFAAHL